MNNPKLRYKRLHEDASHLTFGTPQSACFDIAAYAGVSARVLDCWTPDSKVIKVMPLRDVRDETSTPKHYMVPPRSRILIPTGLILDIPQGYSVRIHARSGLSVKGGLIMANSEGVVDSDYVNEVFVAVYNNSDTYIKINHGDRIAQGEMVPVLNYELEPIAATEEIEQKTERNGGFGSTGVSTR